jgi:glutathione S-transferase
VSNKALGFVVPPEREPSIGYGSFERVMKTLEDAVSSANYLVGDSFTAADVYLGAQIGFGLMFGTLEKRPAFERYWQRISARPAYARARELDDALMPKPKVG